MDWEFIDKRLVFVWFENVKFGIFIYWGLYFVLVWLFKGIYLEWYKYWFDKKILMGNGNFIGIEIYDYYWKMYGEDFIYVDFVFMFKVFSYDFEEWVDLFEYLGVKYVVLIMKYYDGFVLWFSREVLISYGRLWNSMEIGVYCDLVGEYVNVLCKIDIKVGCYFFLREWDNLLYNKEIMDLFYECYWFL